jgi:hypothetical protein
MTLDFIVMFPVKVKFPAGSLTTVFAEAPLIAVLIVLALTVCPLLAHPEAQALVGILLQHRVAQLAVVQFAQLVGIPPTGSRPALLAHTIVLEESIA